MWYPTLYATEADTKDYKIFNCIQVCKNESLADLEDSKIISDGVILGLFAERASELAWVFTDLLCFYGFGRDSASTYMLGSWIGLLSQPIFLFHRLFLR